MAGDDATNLIWALVMLVVVGSALAARRIGFAQAWKMALAWVAIFGLVFIVMLFRHDLGAVAGKLRAAIDPEAGVVHGEALHIPMSDDGHFWVGGRVDGAEVRFLIDSGATTTALSTGAAREAGMRLDGNGFGAMITTANGSIMASRVRIGRLEVGGIVREDLAAISAPEFGEMNVLGMNFLSTLSGWGVEGRTLILKP
jgi:aspartyl protease family protein